MTQSSTSIVVHGASGRLGSRVCSLALDDPRFTLVAALTRPGSPHLGRSSCPGGPALKTAEFLGKSGDSADVVIDVSSDEGARAALSLALSLRAALLVATTGLTPPTVSTIVQASGSIPILIAPNTSLGVAVLASAVAKVAAALGPEYECSVVEAHHSRKKDAPSGTALRLASAIRESGHALKDDQVLAVRGGDVIGEHTVRFAGPGEYLELTHRATSRDLFALGALRAAEWLKGRAPGRYTMEDVLALVKR